MTPRTTPHTTPTPPDGGAGSSREQAILIIDDDGSDDENVLFIAPPAPDHVVDQPPAAVGLPTDCGNPPRAPSTAASDDDGDITFLGPAIRPFILRYFGPARDKSEEDGQHPDLPSSTRPGVIMVPPDTQAYWALSTESPSRHDPPIPYIQLATPKPATSPKGWGLMATRTLKCGDVILRERPFLEVVHPINADEVKAALAGDSFHQQRHRLLFHSFTSTAPGVSSLMEGIAETNVIPLIREDERDGVAASHDPNRSGMFEHMSRGNHSCCPNAGWKWDPSAKEQGREPLQPLLMTVLFARTTILPGEEITASYVSDDETLLPFQKRQSSLLRLFGFVCACSACAVGSKEDERLAACKDVLDACGEAEPENLWANRDCLDRLHRTIIDLAATGRYGLLDTAWTHVFEYYAAWQMRDAAAAAARRAFEALAGKLGWDEARASSQAAWAKAPDSWDRWGCMLVSPAQSASLITTDLVVAGDCRR